MKRLTLHRGITSSRYCRKPKPRDPSNSSKQTSRSYSFSLSQNIPILQTLSGKSTTGSWNLYQDFSSVFPSHSTNNAPRFRHFASNNRPDPFARRPTSKCDPYGQSGKPLTLVEAKKLLQTVEPEWNVLLLEHATIDGYEQSSGDKGECNRGVSTGKDDYAFVPFAIARNFWHDDYMAGAQFINHVAAVAQINAQHFPFQVILDRKLQSRTKSWKICTRVVCRTHVLQGLSHHDFYLATLIDIEIQRPEVKGLVE